MSVMQFQGRTEQAVRPYGGMVEDGRTMGGTTNDGAVREWLREKGKPAAGDMDALRRLAVDMFAAFPDIGGDEVLEHIVRHCQATFSAQAIKRLGDVIGEACDIEREWQSKPKPSETQAPRRAADDKETCGHTGEPDWAKGRDDLFAPIRLKRADGSTVEVPFEAKSFRTGASYFYLPTGIAKDPAFASLSNSAKLFLLTVLYPLAAEWNLVPAGVSDVSKLTHVRHKTVSKLMREVRPFFARIGDKMYSPEITEQIRKLVTTREKGRLGGREKQG